MDDYTPTTEEVREQWASSPVYGYRDPMPVRLAEFDLWLASVRADAWDEGNRAHPKFGVNPYRSEKRDTLS